MPQEAAVQAGCTNRSTTLMSLSQNEAWILSADENTKKGALLWQKDTVVIPATQAVEVGPNQALPIHNEHRGFLLHQSLSERAALAGSRLSKISVENGQKDHKTLCQFGLPNYVKYVTVQPVGCPQHTSLSHGFAPQEASYAWMSGEGCPGIMLSTSG